MTHGGKRKGAGRKPSPKAKRLTIGLRVSDRQREMLRAAAARCDQDLTSWLWDAIMAHIHKTGK